MSVEAWKSIFDIGTVVLLFLTFAFGAGALITGNIINKEQDRQLGQFKVDIANANLGIAQANKSTEDEKSARLQLQAAVQPRDMSLDEQKELKAALHKFSGRIVSIRSYALDTEGSRLATIILSALRTSGIQISDQRGNLFNLSAGWNVVEGIQIAGPHSQDDLISALLKSPLGSDPNLKMFRKEDPKILESAPVEILVGAKPIAPIQ
jgi:hypothetical protein